MIQKIKKATIAASYNRVPTWNGDKVDADITGCNSEWCSKVQAINTKDSVMSISDSTDGIWYVVIRSARDNNDYNIWFDNVCPGNCSNQGTCGTNSDNYGVCQCNANYDVGLSCKQNNQFIEYIILIIIVALVLISALLGLIAWAYMRRRAQYVEVR